MQHLSMLAERREGGVISGVVYLNNPALFSCILPLLISSQTPCPARSEDLLHSCSMVAHCSDFFQVWARSSLEVFTASRMSPMLSCGEQQQQTTERAPRQHAVATQRQLSQ